MYINPIVISGKIVLAQPDFEKVFLQFEGKTVTVNDADFIERNGKKYANIEGLNHELNEIEIPGDIAEMRAQKRKEASLKKGAISIIPYLGESMYFYLEGDKLRIWRNEKEVTVDDIELIHGRKAVNVEGLDLGHPYLELEGKVLQAFEKRLQEKELRSLALVPSGFSLLNGLEYFGLSVDIPAGQWGQVKTHFEYFDTDEGELRGWLTCKPEEVKTILKIC